MKVLVICSYNSNKINPFILDQVESLNQIGIDTSFFLIQGKGVIGYIKNYFRFIKTIINSDYQLIHAHYGLAGLVAVLQFIKPVVVTFHGSDINIEKNRLFSFIAYKLSTFSIFVSKELANNLNAVKKYEVIPCGVDLQTFKPQDKTEQRRKLGLDHYKIYALFSSSFNNPIKNVELAKTALLKFPNIELLELKNFNRTQVAEYMNAVDFLILTSFHEGSPQVVKEAMACNCPIVATNVGDIKDLIYGTNGCYISQVSISELQNKIEMVLNYIKTNNRTSGSEKIKHLSNVVIAKKISLIYEKIIC